MTTDNFFQTVGKDKYVVVKFYTRWCGYCRIMAPEYDKLFDYYKEKRPDIVISRLEASINEEISHKYGIFSFPMVVIFRPGETQIGDLFKGRRTMDVMATWIEINAPGKEEKPISQEKSEERKINENNLDTNIVIKSKSNLTEVTDEVDFLRREIHSLKTKIEKLEEEINTFKEERINNKEQIKKPIDINPKSVQIEDSEISKNNIKLEKAKSIEIAVPSLFTILGTFAAVLLLIALVLTIKKVFIKSKLKQEDISHHKV